MFYEGLYTELGKLFYEIAAVDGNIQPAEKKILQERIDRVWKPLENSTDEFGTDRSALIDFSFDYKESENPGGSGLQSFRAFYRENKSRFSPRIINNILETSEAIASAYRGKNKNEQAILKSIREIFRED